MSQILALGVFIGFRLNNSAFAKSLKIVLNACGINTWLFNSDLITADNFEIEIHRQIKLKADGSIFLLDEAVLESGYMMKKEIPWAVSQLAATKYRLFPILINSQRNLLEKTAIPPEIQYQEIDTKNVESEKLIAENVLRSLLRNHRQLRTIKIRAFDRGEERNDPLYLLNCNYAIILEDSNGTLKFSWKKLIDTLNLQFSCILKEMNSRNIRLSGNLRYTTAFLLGYTYRKSAGFKFSIEYYDAIWETSNQDHLLENSLLAIEKTNMVPDTDLVLNISITHDASKSIQTFIESQSTIRTNISQVKIFPKRGPSPDAIENGTTNSEIANEIFSEILAINNQITIKMVHLFYTGPFPTILILGWLWNAGPKVKIYEYNKAKHTYYVRGPEIH